MRRTPSRLVAGAALAALLAAGCSASPGSAGPSDPVTESEQHPAADAFADDMAALEDRFAARVGVAAVDLETGAAVAHRGDERFGFASTMKAFAAAVLLSETGGGELDAHVTWTREDIEAAGYSPVTELAVDDGLTLAELAEAAVRESDNTAMNLVIDRIGGPAGLRDALRAAGDDTTRPVDLEPDLNDIVPGDDANTSTPQALAGLLEGIATGEWLDDGDRERLLDWMSGNATGDTLIRAGVHDGWEVMDKSGGAGPIRNDVAVLRAPDGGLVALAILTEKRDPDAAWDDALLAEVAGVAVSQLRSDD